MNKNQQAQPSLGTLSTLVKKSQGYLSDCVPQTMRAVMTAERIHKVMMLAARKNPDLIKCSPQSLMFCAAQACGMGLEPGGVSEHIYFVPRGGECTIIVSYRGLMELARRSGKFINIEAHVVYANDDIDVVWGTETRVVHRPCLHGDRGKIIGAHCRADFVGGGFHHEYMTIDDINKVREFSKTEKVWEKHLAEMCRKTVVRRAAKYWPTAVEMEDAILADERSSHEDDVQVIDAQPEAPPPHISAMDAAKAGVAEQIDALGADG